MRKSYILWIIGIVILIALLVWGGQTAKPKVTFWNNTSITCLARGHENLALHIHPVVRIIIDGKSEAIPANVGVTPTCMAEVHTHDTTGTIHLESQQRRDFTLREFFVVWGKSFSASEIFDYRTGDTHKIKVTVNGEDVDTYENTILRDKDEIVINYEPI